MKEPQQQKWFFCLDRGGTFTDIIGLSPDGRLVMDKTPSDSISGGLQILRRELDLAPGALIPADRVAAIRIGTTIATNMLLERKGERTALLLTRGFGDILLIGNQTRPALFALDIRRPPPLYDTVVEVEERLAADGSVICPLNTEHLHSTLTALKQKYDNIAIAFMHASQYPAHEQAAAAMARACGFARVTTSHEVSALMKYIPRAHTAVAEAYLSAGLHQYIRAIQSQCEAAVQILFMQSNGALAATDSLRVVNTILSGPAGGAIGMKKSAARAGYTRAIGFDMGGTSTDICITTSTGRDSLRLENMTAGTPLFVPMLDINTVAAGGGSIVHYRDGRLQVGPHSAGANPGPACYRNNGPLTVTDCNMFTGKLQADFFPAIFGAQQNMPPDTDSLRKKFNQLAETTGIPPLRLAEEFIDIAVEQMAGAINRLATARAVDVSGCILNGFGGAAGQHACLVADACGISTILITRQASVLSAWGISAADIGSVKTRSVDCRPDAPELADVFADLRRAALAELPAAAKNAPGDSGATPGDPGVYSVPATETILRCRYAGVDADIPLRWQPDDPAAMRTEFETQHRARYGYLAPDKAIVAAVAEVSAVITRVAPPAATPAGGATLQAAQRARRRVYFAGKARHTPLYDWERLPAGAVIRGPTIISNALNTIVVEPHWQATLLDSGDLLLKKATTARTAARLRRSKAAMVEIMNSRFTFVAEKMGELLRQTAISVNIRERLDFSCALFDGSGNLVANAPHIPVHLGSMSECVRALHRRKPPGWAHGDIFLINSPYRGGTHLPDLTVIQPGWLRQQRDGAPDFYVAARGHHTDIGGIAPGSMPAASSRISEEGILFDLLPIVQDGVFAEAALRLHLADSSTPARTPDENIADCRAQIAAVAAGVTEMQRSAEEFGEAALRRGLRAVQKNAELAARVALRRLSSGSNTITLDDGSRIAVSINIDKEKGNALFDFSGTSPRHPTNFNAPTAVVRAAVIYCLRVLLGENIPLNDGLLRPVRLRLPRGSLLNPRAPAAVAAGNVETSQNIVDAVLAAFGVCANAQGSCNNLTIGAGDKQYYETIAGGMGASTAAAGADAVQVHMTNSRASDPELLEWHYPLRLETFARRRDSGGAGRHRGGNGAVRRLRFLVAGEANFLTSRRRQPPCGIAGGGDGQCGENLLERRDGTIERLNGCDRAELQAGDCIVIKTPGGGGFGIPEDS